MNRRVFKKSISENDNSDKIIDILEKVLDFNKQKIALTQVKSGNASKTY